MKIKTIECSESIEGFHSGGLKRWKGLRYVAELSEGEDEKEATILLQQKVRENINPSIATDFNTGEQAPILEEQQIDRRIGVLSDDILSSPDLKTLESYKLIVRAKPELQTAYDQRLSQLQNQ